VSGAGKLISAALLVLFVSTSSWSAASFDPPEWAYPQIEDSFAPADWFPADHPLMPKVPVATGRKPDVRACSWCHLPNGLGHPQSGTSRACRRST
jgi:hypothetical protein